MSTPATAQLASSHGVAAGHSVAGLGARSYAFVIDWHIRALLAAAWVLACVAVRWLPALFGAAFEFDFAFMWLAAPAAAIYFLYHPLYEIATHGSTPGKRMAGVRVVRQDGRDAGATIHLVRNLFRLIDALPALYCVGVICCLMNHRQLRVGDYAAGTVLVYDEHDSGVRGRAIDQHAGPHGAEQLALVADLIARWPALESRRRRTLAVALLQLFGDPPVAPDDEAALLARLRAALDRAGRA